MRSIVSSEYLSNVVGFGGRADKISGCKGGAPSLCSTTGAARYSLLAVAAPQGAACAETLTPAVMLCNAL
jgi:hypothetical protein